MISQRFFKFVGKNDSGRGVSNRVVCIFGDWSGWLEFEDFCSSLKLFAAFLIVLRFLRWPCANVVGWLQFVESMEAKV